MRSWGGLALPDLAVGYGAIFHGSTYVWTPPHGHTEHQLDATLGSAVLTQAEPGNIQTADDSGFT